MTLILHIEVQQKLSSSATKEAVKDACSQFINNKSESLRSKLEITSFDETFLNENVQSMKLCETTNEEDLKNFDLKNTIIHYHIYRLEQEGGQLEPLGEGDNPDDPAAAHHWILPSADFHGLWESLIYDSSIKENLLNFVESTLMFSTHLVDSNIITWNRVVLLHGPPGTGKTSLCKALAQKLSIRFNDRFSHGELIEINSHSLFSKWFSESGKLVMKMFAKIRELLSNEDTLVCVLIDEVESLTHARSASTAGRNEPSDAVRVVNAVLTQIDHIRKYHNALILTTSNVTEAIDAAFVDRADIKQYIGPPSEVAIYSIYVSCLNELSRAGIIVDADTVLEHKWLAFYRFEDSLTTRSSLELLKIARDSVGLSGRSLRKMPFLAHAFFLHKDGITLDQYLNALSMAVSKHKQEKQQLSCL